MAATKLKPDLLVLNLSMPGMGGLAALHELRSKSIAAKAVIVSTTADPAYARRALQLGATGRGSP